MKNELNLENNFNSIRDKSWGDSDLNLKRSISLSLKS